MKIDVTQEDIDAGVCRNPFSCAVALAISRLIKPGLTVSVCGEIDVYDSMPLGDDVDITKSTPNTVSDFIDAFDKDKRAVAPFSFELDLPAEVLA